ncbi:MAG TPA: hypothetical protein VFW95_13380 [Candidatus Limnocylindria bacterium]|nr:hypothetical protein [Candidatus Limnocylindria bacterium]
MSVDSPGAAVPGAARRRAAEIVRSLRPADGCAIAVAGIDVGPALEQQVYFALRDQDPAATGISAALKRRALPVGALLASLRPRRRPRPDRGGVLLLIRGEVHARAFAPVAEALGEHPDLPVVTVRVGQAAASRDPRIRATPRLVDLMEGAPARAALRSSRLATSLARRVAELEPSIGRVVREQVPRLAVAAAGLRSATEAVRPRLLVTYDEAGSWGRLLVAEGRRSGVPVLDLPHAELVNPEILVGADFDAMAVYGTASRDLALAAGVQATRVRVVGSVRHDQLAAMAGERRRDAGASELRITFAAQYPTAGIADTTLEAALHDTLIAAGSVAPAIVRIVPHPIGPPGLVQRWLRTAQVLDGVRVDERAAGDLYEALLDSDLLVTVTSQSVLEAAVVGIPAVSIQPPGSELAFPYAAERIADVALDATALAERFAALRSPVAAAAAVDRARANVARHLGPMDGRAAQRSAELVAELVDAGYAV